MSIPSFCVQGGDALCWECLDSPMVWIARTGMKFRYTKPQGCHVSPREFWRLRKIHSSACKSWWRELGHFGTEQKFLRFEITTPRYSGALSSTLRFECTSDTSASHKKQEAKWDRCGGERVKRPCRFATLFMTVLELFVLWPSGWLAKQCVRWYSQCNQFWVTTLLDDCKKRYQEVSLCI